MMLRFTVFLAILPLIFCSCPSGSHEWHSNCYTFVPVATSFLDAEAHCISLGGHLASIHDGFENSYLAGQAKQIFQNHFDDFWIGLSNTQTLSSLTWIDGTVFDFAEWAASQPGPLNVNTCAAVNVNNGYWKTDNFFKQKPYICETENIFNTPSTRPPTTTTRRTTTTTRKSTTLRSTRTSSTTPPQKQCPGNFTYFYPTNSCYGVFYTAEYYGKNWIYGENFCVNLGGHLASVHSDAEINFIMHLSSIQSSNFFPWTGLFTNNRGYWQWSDGSPVDYLPGNPNPGSYICTFINEYNVLEEDDCRDDLTVLCKM